jgi:hypothetical protein
MGIGLILVHNSMWVYVHVRTLPIRPSTHTMELTWLSTKMANCLHNPVIKLSTQGTVQVPRHHILGFIVVRHVGMRLPLLEGMFCRHRITANTILVAVPSSGSYWFIPFNRSKTSYTPQGVAKGSAFHHP